MPPLFNSLIAWPSKMSLEGPFLSSLLVCSGQADGMEISRAGAEFVQTHKQAEIPSDAH